MVHGNRMYCVVMMVVGALSQLACAIDEEKLALSGLIQKRYYIIKRLERPMHVFCMMRAHEQTGKTVPLNTLMQEKLINSFHAPAIKQALVCMIEQQTIEPVIQLWGEFLAYKNVDDHEFTKEMVALILLLYKYLLFAMADKKEEMQLLLARAEQCIAHNLYNNNQYPGYKRIDISTKNGYNDALTSLLVEQHAQQEVGHAVESGDIAEDVGLLVNLLQKELSIEDTTCFVVDNTIRFYHIQRMMKALYRVSSSKSSIMLQRNLHVYFHNPHIKQCFDKICVSNSIKPLLHVWQSFMAYDFIHDEQATHEFMTLLVLVYYGLIAQESSERRGEHNDDGSAHDAVVLFETIASLPIPELLDLLDELVDEFDGIVEHYELNNEALSWSAWFKKYWWLPPALIISVAAIVFKTVHTTKHALKL